MANLSNYIGDANQRPEQPEPNVVERGINLLDVAVKSAAYSALQQPMDGLTQLVGIKAPKLIDEGKHYEFNTPEWYASTVGHGAGFMVPFMATSKLTGLTGMKAGVGKAMLDGAVSGFALTPTKEGEDAFATRSLAAFSSSVMFGTQHALAGQLTSRMVGMAESAPIMTRLGINTGTGVVAGLTSLEATSLIQGNGFVTDKQTLVENAVSAAATGFALDAFNIGASKLRGSSRDGSAPAPAQQGKSELGAGKSELGAGKSELGAGKSELGAGKSELGAGKTETSAGSAESRTEVKQQRVQGFAEVGDATTNAPLTAPEAYKQIGQWTDSNSGHVGAKQYRTEMGETFWQIPDGRIYYETGTPENPIYKTWSPFGSGDPATFLGPEGKMGRQIWTRHEPQGFFFNEDGVQHSRELYNMFDDPAVVDKPSLPPQLAHDLALSVPRHIETDAAAFTRIARTTDGALYEPTTVEIRVPKAGRPPNNITMTDYINNWTEPQTLPARRYNIANGDNTGTTAVIIPEQYAAKLDQVRELRKLAVQDPAQTPELREDILRARRDLFTSGYADRLLPEHWGQFIDVLPNAKTIKELQLVDSHDPEGKTIAETAIEHGRIRFFAENNGIQQHVRRTLLHEWTHTAEATQKALRSAYEGATKLEQFKGREYAETNTHEDWAVHFAEMLMDPNPELFMTIANKSPIRTVILGEALRHELNGSPEHTSINKPEFEARLRYIDQHVLPQAKEQVMKAMRSNDIGTVTEATQIIDRLSRSEKPSDKQLAERLFDKDSIAKGIDRGLEALSKDLDTAFAARLLQRMELLRQMDPQMAESRLDGATQLTARLRNRFTRMLESNEHVESALTMGEQLSSGGMADAVVFRRTFPLESLAQVAKTNGDAALADRAFNLARNAFAAAPVDALALEIMQTNGTARGAAAEYALSRNDSKIVGQATELLSRQLLLGNTAALSPEAVTALNKALDANVADIVGGKNRDAAEALRALARGRLYQDYLISQFQNSTPAMQARAGRITQLERVVRQLVEAKRNGTPDEQREIANAIAQMPPGLLDTPQNSSGIILL